MLLTLKQPAHQGFKSVHDYSPPTPPSTSRFSPALTHAGPSFPSLPPITKSTLNPPMSTPHRGLPPPAAMTLPQPSQGPPPLSHSSSLNQPMGPLPAPPQQWQGAEESMRNWLHAKAEEDKRKQEEEKTRQEGLRLEQRKIEQDMLRTSLSGGIPPYMIPMVFAGMGGGNLPNASLEWAQHYMAQAHHAQQQQLQQQSLAPPPPQPSPELRRESRQIGQIYGPSQHPVPAPLPSTPSVSSGPPSSAFLPNYPMSPSSRSRGQLPGPGSLARGPPSSQLPRLNTGEMHIQAPPQAPSGMQMLPGQPAHPLHQSQSAQQSQQESQSSPSIYFHHWQPPTSHTGTGGGNQPTTPSDAPSSSSPKKRKAQGPQQAAPPPTSQPQYTSPPFSQTGSSVSNTPSNRRRGHSRQRSDLSSRGLDSYGRPGSRRRLSESGEVPRQEQGFETSREGPSSERQATKAERIETPQRQAQHNQQYEGSFSAGPEMRRDERLSAEQDRERGHSSRPSGKRDDMRD